MPKTAISALIYLKCQTRKSCNDELFLDRWLNMMPLFLRMQPRGKLGAKPLLSTFTLTKGAG